MSVMFRDNKKRTLEVDPFLIRWAHTNSESDFKREEEDARNLEKKKKKAKERHYLSLKYGLKFCLNSLGKLIECTVQYI